MSSDGTIVAIGAPYNDDNGADITTGHMRVFKWNGALWSQLGADIDDGYKAYSGSAVALSGDGTILAIG